MGEWLQQQVKWVWVWVGFVVAEMNMGTIWVWVDIHSATSLQAAVCPLVTDV